MIQEILLLLLLAVRASPVLMAEVSVLEGSSVTLLCGYSVKDHGYDTRWGRNCYDKFWGECGCSKPRVIKKAAISPNDPKKYSLSGEKLTISNLQLKDRGSYCCCVDITSVFSQDCTEYYNLKVVKGCERNLMKGVDFGINNMFQSPPFVTNASQCRQKCTEHYNCQYFTFVWKEAGINNQNNRHLCFLMASTDDMPVTIQYLEHATSGYSLKNCSGIITYSAKKYSLVLEEKNWTEAQEYCRQHYTNLSIIHTEEDWKAIQSSLGNFIGDVWIGLHRSGPTEKWKWSDGEDFMFFNWEKGFGVHTVGHDCVLSISSHWQPVSCATQRQYMCQREVHHGNGTTEKVYDLMPGTKTQQDALKDCRSKSRDLASILNQKEQEAFDEVTEGETWIGLEHNNSNTLWEWSNGEPFQQWENTRVDGNCVQLNRKWRPKDCSRQSAFLCYGDEHPLNNTGDLNTPVTPETTSPTSTGPPSTEMFTTTPTTSPTTTTNGQSTTSPNTTTNGQSTTSPTTTTNGQSTTSPNTTTNGQSTTSPNTTSKGQSTTSPTTTSKGQSTTSPTTTSKGQSTTSPTTTTNGQSTTSPTTTSKGQSTTSPTTTSKGQSTTSPTTTTNGQSTTSPTTTSKGQSTTSPTTTSKGQSTTSPTTTSKGQSTTSPTTTTNGQSTTSPTTTTNGQSTTSPNTTTNGQSTTSPTTTSKGQSTTSPTTTSKGQSTTSPTTTTNGQSTTSPTTTSKGQSTTSPTTTSKGQSTTSPNTTTNGQSTTSPTTTSKGQSTTSPTTTSKGQSTTSPTTTSKGQSTTSPTTTSKGQSTTSPTTTSKGQSTTSPTTTSKGQSTTSPTTTSKGQSTTSPTTTSKGQSTTSPTTTSKGQSTTSPNTTTNGQSTTSPTTTNYLHFFNESKSWINSLKFCKSRGSKSNLVQITNQTVHADVTQLLANVELQCGEVWIGLERSIFEWNAPWLWTGSDVDKVVKYSEWHSCFPLNPINYHCGKMVRVGNGELKWLDASCHQELPFICQGVLLNF
uniref:aggrecan core protein-like isoform X3 n=1 Tax=Oncorhynchus gorbuscha TaxID=8017 RepID=UPI001EAEFC5C|nr:aggrecan core protein-like isoform X3 [Oncorhynchus gorbuscha]